MNYSGMPMGMWYLYEKSFKDKLVSVMGYDQETADGAANKAKWKYKSIIDKLPEFAAVTGSLLVSMIFVTATLQEIRNREVFMSPRKSEGCFV